MTNILRIYRVFRSNPTLFQVKLRTMPFTLVGRKEIMNFLKVLKSNPKTQNGYATLCFGIRNIGQAFVKVLKNDESFLVYAVVAFTAYLSRIIVD